MDNATLFTVIISVVGALSTNQAFDFYQKRAQLKKDEGSEKTKEENLYRDDLREEVVSLRGKVDVLMSEKEDVTRTLMEEKEDISRKFMEKINELSQELAAMKVRVEFLERENKDLREKKE